MERPVDWKDFFDSHAERYDENGFAQWTTTEVTFLIDRLELAPGASILDIGCGTGRHAIEFTKRGYSVVGVDQSSGMLAKARAKAAAEQLEIEFVEADARDVRLERTFDLAICLCEGGFNLAGADTDPVSSDLAILRTAFTHVKPGGRFVLNALNGYATIRQMTDELVDAGVFDPATMLSQYVDTWKLPEGERQVTVRERLFVPPEVVAMLRYVGFDVEHVWGGTAGAWGARALRLDEIEAMFHGR